ncbi:MAG: hypothetical protein RLZZ359_1025, partial [Actinomycetota bacterium]
DKNIALAILPGASFKEPLVCLDFVWVRKSPQCIFNIEGCFVRHAITIGLLDRTNHNQAVAGNWGVFGGLGWVQLNAG